MGGFLSGIECLSWNISERARHMTRQTWRRIGEEAR